MRRILMSSLAMALLLALAACGRDEPPPPQPLPQPEPATAPPATTAPATPASATAGRPIVEGEIDTEGDLTPEERAAIASQRAEGEASTDDDGTDAQGNVRSHTEAETAAAEETETPEEHEIDDDEGDERRE